MKVFKFTCNFLVLVIICFLQTSAEAQALLDTGVFIPEDVELSEGQQDQITDAASNVFKKYAQKATLLDPLENKVTQSSLREFKNLFYSGAKVVNDLSRYFVISSAADYGGTVYEYMTETGVSYDAITQGLLKEIYYDKAGYYVARVIFLKTLHNGLETNNDIFRCNSGREYRLTMLVRLEEDNLSQARILRIDGQKGSTCEDPFSQAGFSLEGGADFFGLSGGKTDDNNIVGIQREYTDRGQEFYKTESEFKMELSSVASYGAGINYLLPISKREVFFLNIGASFMYNSLTTNANGSYAFEDSEKIKDDGFEVVNGDFDDAYKLVNIVGAVENVNILAIQFPVGLRYSKKPKQGRKHNFMLDVQALPILQIGNNKVDLTADSISYNHYYGNSANDDFLDPYENGLGLGSVNYRNPTVSPTIWTNTFSVAVRVAPGFRYRLTDNIIAEGSVNVTYGLNSFTTASADGGYSPYPLQDEKHDLTITTDELGGSLLENYYDSVPVSTIGLRLGVVYVFR